MRRKSKETKMSGRTWWYVSKYVNPEQTINDLNREYGTIDSSPVFFGFWVKVVLYKVALKDVQENLHSLIEERTCTCGLTLEVIRISNPYLRTQGIEITKLLK